jgi:hypothetical protein
LNADRDIFDYEVGDVVDSDEESTAWRRYRGALLDGIRARQRGGLAAWRVRVVTA